MKYKNLKSVAHSLGHSFMSLMNYRDSDHIVEYLLKTAKEYKSHIIEIDFLNQEIYPEEFRIEPVIESLKSYREHFPKDLESQNCSIDHIKKVKMNIEFDIDSIKFSENLPGLELPNYKFVVSILDDRGRLHEASVVEWWRY
jgi:hypothetical protein